MTEVIRARIVQPQVCARIIQPRVSARIHELVFRVKLAETATITSTTNIHTGGGSIGASFVAGDLAAGSLLIGTVQPGTRIDRVALHIDQPFDGSIQLTVGDDAAQARLMAAAENAPGVTGRYAADVDHEYTAETDIKLYLAAGLPSVGAGQVIIYL